MRSNRYATSPAVSACCSNKIPDGNAYSYILQSKGSIEKKVYFVIASASTCGRCKGEQYLDVVHHTGRLQEVLNAPRNESIS